MPWAVDYRSLEPALATVLEQRAPGRALDLATGTGRNAIAMAEAGWTVHAIDISRAKLERAQARASEHAVPIEWILADVDRFVFPAASYDLVTISFFDARTRLAAIEATLAPGGLLVYEHYLQSGAGTGNAFRFEAGELPSRLSTLEVCRYDERRDDDPRVTLVARRPS